MISDYLKLRPKKPKKEKAAFVADYDWNHHIYCDDIFPYFLIIRFARGGRRTIPPSWHR